ncbi:MAG TPA: isoprenylcysteine carboxylmethyltransferase family protein [Rhizomicrobium sp.]|jgi:protein-S-isoprenylcysteine O-methyltransferase Ste14|nr:isoprenylcysteine carboxylmethyltransferase family protein [Rhizomicrobium sp.]
MVRIPPPIWMLLFLAVAAAVSFYYPVGTVPPRPVLGAVLVVAGASLGFWAFRLFRTEGTELNPASEANKTLVVRGPFRFTRNPMYLGLVLLSLGIAFWAGAVPMFVVPVLVFAVANWVHIPFEEAKMRHQFGAAFDDYTRSVRRWI